MKLVPILLFLLCGVAVAQQYHYPVIRAAGHSLGDFIPAGWKMIGSAAGDLNGDARSDAAIVIESNDSAMEVREFDVPNATPDRMKPRILIILFRDSSADRYRLAAQNNTFILRSSEGNNFDPFVDEGGITIAGRVLNIRFYGGGWDRFAVTYRFRYQDGEFTLIGADNITMDTREGDNGATETWSYNFLTKKLKITKDSFSDEKVKPRVTWRTLKIKELRTFRTFPAPFTWEIFKNVYL
jgi:hypothetical protein